MSDEAGRRVGTSGTVRAGATGSTAATTARVTTAPNAEPPAKLPREADLQPRRFPDLSWGDGDLVASLEAVYHWVEGEAIRAAAWYVHEKKWKARWSRALRILAILFATAGAAIPFVAANSDSVGFEWGYVLLACAAGAVAMDRFFGFSSAWMRYMTAELAIQRRLQELQFAWTSMLIARGNRAPSAHEVAAELDKLAAAAAAIADEVRLETMTWADEFQSNIGELRSLASRHEA